MNERGYMHAPDWYFLLVYLLTYLGLYFRPHRRVRNLSENVNSINHDHR